ncbi:lectin-like domain-containing protein [Flavobacterium beibuense]|uniref:lectin-like domain-containing protein n=1 Tax=Flavobacterium beibuense TaxID=657326 RepID=UPI003A94707B
MKNNLVLFNKQALLLFVACLLLSAKSFAQLTPSFLNSAAETGDGCYTITNNVQTNSGAAWYDNPIDLTNDFDIVFNAYFGSNYFGADGMAFILKTTPDALIGNLGGGLGYRNFPEENTLAVEFDTYSNSGTTIADPSYNHVALQTNGNVSHVSPDNLVAPVQASPTSANIKDNTEHEVKIKWRAEAQTLTVVFDCSERFTYTADLVNTIFGGNTTVYFGFTGSTGQQSNHQYICFQYLSFLDTQIQDQVACAGEPVNTIDATYVGAVSYQWSPIEGVSDPTIPNPVFTVSETTTYTLLITDNCGETMEEEYTITVVNPTAEVNTVQSSICNGEMAEFVITGTPNTEVVYTINNGAEQTVILDASGEATVSTQANDNQTINLVSVTLTEAPFCEVDLTGTATVEIITEDASFYMTAGCEGATATVTGVMGGMFAFNPAPEDAAIIDASTGEITNALAGASYTVEYTTPNCLNTTVSQVTVYPEVTYNMASNLQLCDTNGDGIASFDLTQIEDEVLTNNADMVSYAYDNDGNMLSIASPSAFENTQPGGQTIWLTIENQNGCTATTSFDLIVDQCFIQKGISPNGDGKNDFFDLSGFGVKELTVFNRYGEKVYSYSNYTTQWEGQSDNGNELPTGTYYYAISFSDSNPTYGTNHTGWVYINRQEN